MDSEVSVVRDAMARYPSPPFDPPEVYPEFSTADQTVGGVQADNRVYPLVRRSLAELGLDSAHLGTPEWSPMRDVVQPGDHVIIKPNLVLDTHPLGLAGVEAMITHSAVLRPLIDYVWKAARGHCHISICDVPLQSANWSRLIEFSGLEDLVRLCRERGMNVDLLDLRYEIAQTNEWELIVNRDRRARDPKGYRTVDLGECSYIAEIHEDANRLEITDYGTGTVARHHGQAKNEYLICGTILDGDVFINVPKLKTHKKAGITVAMKNLIGINGDKSWIAHHRRGEDEYPEFHLPSYLKWYASHYAKRYAPLWVSRLLYWTYQRLVLRKKLSQAVLDQQGGIMEGNWYGNDTLWRTILDLNNIIFFADKNGQMQRIRQRKYLTVVDGIIAMDREGPMHGTPRPEGVVIAGRHPLPVDTVAAQIMGFDWQKIPCLANGWKERFFGLTPFGPTEMHVRNVDAAVEGGTPFVPARGWVGHIEGTTAR